MVSARVITQTAPAMAEQLDRLNPTPGLDKDSIIAWQWEQIRRLREQVQYWKDIADKGNHIAQPDKKVELLTAKAFAVACGVSESAMCHALAKGQVKGYAVKKGGQWRIDPGATYIASKRGRPAKRAQ